MRRARVIASNGLAVGSEAHSYSHTANSIAPTQATICAVLLIVCGERSVISDDLANAVVSGYHDCAVFAGSFG